jgi:hypothetical protein
MLAGALGRPIRLPAGAPVTTVIGHEPWRACPRTSSVKSSSSWIPVSTPNVISPFLRLDVGEEEADRDCTREAPAG